MTAGTKRRVRVVIEAEAHEISGKCGLLRLDMERDETGLVPVVMVNPSWAGVSVEDVAPSYNWQDGDAVQDTFGGEVFARHGGVWSGTMAQVHGRVTDGTVTSWLNDDSEWLVLRYQAGEN